jgi:hypothetical protein
MSFTEHDAQPLLLPESVFKDFQKIIPINPIAPKNKVKTNIS